MSGSGQEAFPNIRELSREPPRWPGVVRDPYKYPGMVGRPSWMSESGRETLRDVQELLEGPLKYPGVVGRSSQIS